MRQIDMGFLVAGERAMGAPLPVQWPVRFTAQSGGVQVADSQIWDELVALTKQDQGTDITTLIPMRDFLGVVVGVAKEGAVEEALVVLRHRDGPDGAVGDIPLTAAREHGDVEALLRIWREWAAALHLPAYVEMPEGRLEAAPLASRSLYMGVPQPRRCEAGRVRERR